MPPHRTMSSSKEGKVRQRSSRACQPCRRRKIKCDGKDPCEACLGYGYECVYTERGERQPHNEPLSTASGPPPKDLPVPDKKSSELASEAKTDAPYMAVESIITNPETEGFLLRATRTRFTSAYSAVAWPKALGRSLDIPIPPRLQSFAWNPGQRSEAKIVPQTCLTNIITLDEMRRYTNAFFNEVNPIFGLVNREAFTQKSDEFWILKKRGIDFESVTCGMVALGSYFSRVPLAQEAEVVEQGRLLLDFTTAHAPGFLAFNHVQAWILRAIYLRSTTRPHLAWMASNTAVQIAEALGMHRDLCEAQMKEELRRLLVDTEATMRRRVFWMAISLNQFLSLEYGRTRASIEFISCLPPDPSSDPKDLLLQTLSILQSVPKMQNMLSRGPELLEVLQSAMVLPVSSPFLSLLRADACFCTYRMLHSTNVKLSSGQVASLLEVIRVGLEGATFIARLSRPWWNVVYTPFHSVCILLSLNTGNSLAMIPSALETLKNATTAFDSHLSREATRTAHNLVSGAREKKMKEIECLDRGIESVFSVLQSPESDLASAKLDFEWSMDNETGLADFMDFGSYGFELDALLSLPNTDLIPSADQ